MSAKEVVEKPVKDNKQAVTINTIFFIMLLPFAYTLLKTEPEKEIHMLINHPLV